MEEIVELTLHLTHVDFGHADGQVTRLMFQGGPLAVDMMQLQNGTARDLLDREDLPAGPYEWMEIGIDPQQSHVGTQDGGHHALFMGEELALRVHAPFAIHAGEHSEFILDFDLRYGIEHRHMGGMMGDRYILHPGLRQMLVSETGGLVGAIDASLVDVNQPGCDPAPGGNWAYLFDGAVAQPDDFAVSETDNLEGPIATDRVELHPGIGEYRYHFAFVPAGSYRVAFTCSGEWDEAGDDDFPDDPDGEFGFQAFSAPIDVVAGEIQVLDIGP
jgi:hypothetical protein